MAVSLVGFLASKSVAKRSKLRDVAETNPDANAGVMMGHFQAAGLVAPAQADTLLNAFREQQRDALQAMLASTVQDGLVDAQTSESAQAKFEPQLLSMTPEQFLVDEGLLTQDQAQKYSGAVAGAARAVQGVVSGAASGGKTLGMRLLNGFKSLPMLGKLAIGGGALLVGALGLCVVSAVWVALQPEPIEPDCVMNGFGNGTCTFTNTTNETSSSSCGYILARCSGRGSKTSATFCSGEVDPGESKEMDFSVARFDRITPPGDWRDSCEFGWVDE